MILVDTSVLISFFRGDQTDAGNKFKEVLERRTPFGITSQIFQEILQGAATVKEFETLKRYLETQHFYQPKDPIASYAKASKIYFDCRRKGVTIRSTIDCLIAQIAMEHDLFLLHSDNDFTAMTTVLPLKEF